MSEGFVLNSEPDIKAGNILANGVSSTGNKTGLKQASFETGFQESYKNSL